MSDASGVQLGFAKLSGRENYNEWKFGMRMALIHCDLWQCIEGYSEDDKTKPEEWKRRDQKALAKICLMVNPVAYPHVRTAKTAEEAWTNLQKAYEDKGLYRRLSLFKTLVRVRLENFRKMEDYVNEVMSVAQKLSDIDAPVDDEFLGVVLLSGLTSEYDPMVMALENSGQKITSDFIKTKLLSDDKYSNDKPKDLAFLSRDNKYLKKSIKCYGCGGLGHYKSQCQKVKNKPSKSFQNHQRDNYFKDTNGSDSKVTKSKVTNNCALHVVLTATNNSQFEDWFIDSGATNHMCSKKELLKDLHTSEEFTVTVADDRKVSAQGKGDVVISTKYGVKTINDVMYVPDLKTNLLSVSKITEKGRVVLFTSSGCRIYDETDFVSKGTVIANGSNNQGLYRLDTYPHSSFIASHSESQEIWHRRLGHLNRVSMNLLKNGMADGVNYTDNKGQQCAACVVGKQTRKPFKDVGKRAKELLELLHSDLAGPMPTSSWSGSRYIFSIIDDFSRKIFVYFIKSKSETLKCFKDFAIWAENQTGHRIKTIRTDQGTEYVNHEFDSFLKSKGINHQMSVRYSPEQNGVAERTNRTMLDKARCLMQESHCDERMWAEAVNTAVYLKNRSPHKAVKGATPEEVWSGEKVNLSHLKVFGCVAYSHVPDQLRKKFEPKSEPYIFVGYSNESKGYRLFDVRRPGKIVIARDVIFFEDKFKIEDMSPKVEVIETQLKSTVIEEEPQTSTNQPMDNTPSDESEAFLGFSESDNDSDVSDKQNERPSVIPRRSSRERTRKVFPGYEVYLSTTVPDIPSSYKEATRGPEREMWMASMKEEYQALMDNEVWTLVEKPNGKRIVECKWVYNLKTGSNGNVKYKSRLVAKGFTQEYGVDYHETFSPVVRSSSIRLLFALSVNLNLVIYHVDVNTAFLNSELDKQIYMYQPEGFVKKGQEDLVCYLKRAIYGLKQSSRLWNKNVENFLLKLDFTKSVYEPCIFYKFHCKSVIIVAIYVDDFLIFTNDVREKNSLVSDMSKVFKIKDLGEAKNVLGMNIEQSEDSIKVNQKDYIIKLLKDFNLLDCHPSKTPIEARLKLDKGSNVNDSITYQRLIGSLMYLAVHTRPDIAFSLSFLSQFNTYCNQTHFQYAKRVLKYLKGSLNKNLVFSKGSGNIIIGYADADWANDINDFKSYSGFVFKLAGGAISWEARKQRCVALSSTEAEYISLSEASKEACFLKGLYSELSGVDEPILLFNDNQSSQKLVKNAVFHNRTKHINVRYHFVRETTEKGIINLKYCNTQEMVADIFTKGLPLSKHDFCTKNLGLK